MELKNFKTQLVNNNVLSNVMVFRCTYNGEFLFHQYINYYADMNGLEIEHIDSLDSLITNDIFGGVSNVVYLYEIDELKDTITTSNNVWVKCKKVNKKVTNDVVELGKIEDWQIKDYVYSMCDGVPTKELDTIFSNYRGNLYRLENEVSKVSLCHSYDDIKDQLYTDISEYSIFDIVNSIVRRDKELTIKCLKELECIDVDVFGLLKLLKDNFKRVIDIQLSHNATPEYVGVSSKQFWAIKNFSCNHYSQEELVNIYKILLDVDGMIKTGYMDVSNVVDYLITKICL